MAVLWKNTSNVPLDQQGALVSPLTAVVYEAEERECRIGTDKDPSKLVMNTAGQAAPGDGAPSLCLCGARRQHDETSE